MRLNTCLTLTLIFVFGITGCRTAFNLNLNNDGKFTISLNQPSKNSISNMSTSNNIIAQFEAIEEENDAVKNLTNKASANCAGGVCTIY